MTKTVLTTRAHEDAMEDIAFLEAKGITAISAPMLEIHGLEIDPKSIPSDIDAIAFTSRNAPGYLMAATDTFRAAAAYCVGEATAEAARAAGFTNAVFDGDAAAGHGGAALAKRIIAATPKPRHILWASGVHRSDDLASALTGGGIQVSTIPVYEARKTPAIQEAATAALKSGGSMVVLVHSGRAGENLARLMEANAIGRSNIHLVAVSRKAAGLCGKGWLTITIPETPDRAAMLNAAIKKTGTR